MAGRLNRLTSRAVDTISKPGRHSDGGGLYLLIRPNGTRYWTFLYERKIDGKRVQREIGLGSAGRDGNLSLADARATAAEHRKALGAGLDPLTVKNAAEAERRAKATTFGQYADDFVKAHSSKWSNAKHAAQWRSTLGDAYCRSIRGKSVSEIDTAVVLKVLKPIWTEKPETARRIRMRIEAVLDAAKVEGLRDGENPARLKGHLAHLLPRHAKGTKGHHAAMDFREVPAFMAELATRDATAALALRFLILTATRTSETLNARWSEIDMAKRVWTISASRMKARRDHRIPLSVTALEVLETVSGKHLEWVFPAPDGKGPLSNMALLMQLRRMKRAATVHGFRSSFRDWAAETTNFPREVAEAALAHVIGDDTEAAYRRGDLFDKRRKLMDAWAGYLTTTRGGNVVKLHGTR